MEVYINFSQQSHPYTTNFLIDVSRGITNGWSNLPLTIQPIIKSVEIKPIPGASIAQVTVKVSWNLTTYSETEEGAFRVRDYKHKGTERVSYAEIKFKETVLELIKTLAKELKQDVDSVSRLLIEGE